MSREQDLLFCKIAIANGIVSEEQAKKALAIVNQREQETGRRPMIGAIFSKYNLINQRDVQTLYQAVNKRLGGTASIPGRLPAGSREAARAARRGGRGFGGERRAPRKIDPQTLWMGIGFGVVFVGIVVGLVITWVVYDPKDGSEESSSAVSSDGASGRSPGTRQREATVGETANSEDTSSAAAVAPPKEMVPEIRSKIIQALNDSRRDSVDGNTQRALQRLEAALADIEKQQIFVEPALLTQLQQDRDNYKSGDMPGGGEGEGGDDLDNGFGDDL